MTVFIASLAHFLFLKMPENVLKWRLEISFGQWSVIGFWFHL